MDVRFAEIQFGTSFQLVGLSIVFANGRLCRNVVWPGASVDLLSIEEVIVEQPHLGLLHSMKQTKLWKFFQNQRRVTPRSKQAVNPQEHIFPGRIWAAEKMSESP